MLRRERRVERPADDQRKQLVVGDLGDGRRPPDLPVSENRHPIGYLANLALLYVFTDRLGYPHQVVQAAAIFVVAGILFLLFRFFVFPAVPHAGKLP